MNFNLFNKKDPYPDPIVHKIIMDTFLSDSTLGLKLVGSYEEVLFEGTRAWKYRFKRSFSPVEIWFSLLCPISYGTCRIVKGQKSFSLGEYLKMIDKVEGYNPFDQSFKTLPEDLKIIEFQRYQDVIKKYITTDLRKVVRGEEWIKVPTDWSIIGR